MTQQVEGGDEVAPLHQLAQRATAEGILCDLEARLLCQQAKVHQDLSGEEPQNWIPVRAGEALHAEPL